jgi:ribosomal protein L44E
MALKKKKTTTSNRNYGHRHNQERNSGVGGGKNPVLTNKQKNSPILDAEIETISTNINRVLFFKHLISSFSFK